MSWYKVAKEHVKTRVYKESNRLRLFLGLQAVPPYADYPERKNTRSAIKAANRKELIVQLTVLCLSLEAIFRIIDLWNT